MVNKKVLLGCLLLFAVALVTLPSAQPLTPDEAETSIQASYPAILNAYHAGADTTPLITQINQALNLTQQAKSIQPTNPQIAQELTSQAQTIAQNVTAQAQTAAQSASIGVPAVIVVVVITLLTAGLLIDVFGPRLFWRIWFRLRRNYRVNATNSKPDSKALVITPQHLSVAFLALMVLFASVAVSGVLLPQRQDESFSELGVLGPNMQLSDYPSELVASESVRLYVYVGNQMGQPMFYQVQVKLGDNNTQVDPADTVVLAENQQVIGANQSWTYPVQVTLNQPGDNQRLIFELWIYNQTLGQFQYHQRWGQIWLNVTAPAS
jgi:hypothetical protein